MWNANFSITAANRNAVISLIAAILPSISLWTAVAPVPFTGLLCYPAAAPLGLVALITGLNALRHMRSIGENGRMLATIGVGVGGLATARNSSQQ
jgi:hypothetical protein